MNPHPPADWSEFWVRFVCGAIFGTAVGLFGCQNIVSSHAGLAVPVCSVLIGLVAGWFGDRFWYSLRHWFW